MKTIIQGLNDHEYYNYVLKLRTFCKINQKTLAVLIRTNNLKSTIVALKCQKDHQNHKTMSG